MIVGLVGEPGAGKTTIAKQLQSWTEGVPHFLRTISTSGVLTDEEKAQVLGPEEKIRLEVAIQIRKAFSDQVKHAVIDSMPRMLGQLFWLHQIAFYETVGPELALVFVDVKPGLALERLVARGREGEEHWLARNDQARETIEAVRHYRPAKSLRVTNDDSIENAKEVWAWLQSQG